MAKGILKEIRERIITAYMNNTDIKTISVLFGCTVTTVKRIISRFNEVGEVGPKTRDGSRNIKILNLHKDAIKSYIAENCSITLKEIQLRLESDFSLSVSMSSIDRAITSFSFTLKRLSIIPERRNNLVVIEERFQYSMNFYSLITIEDGRDIYFLDEVGFNVSMRSRRGRSLLGTAAAMSVEKIRSRNISICCVMSRNGAFYYKKQLRAFNIENFADFIDELLAKFELHGLIGRTIVMDNVRFHHSSIICLKIVEKGHKVLFLPPYSPFLNPIENMFAQWKQYVRGSRPTDEASLFSLIDEKFNFITDNHCNNYYRHMLENMHKCILKEEIIDN
jgi:transposase